jgi:DNA-binding transcriptional LysR family regulator
LAFFVALAQDRSFRRASARLGLSPSSLSHSIRELDDRLGAKLLNRTTRSVAPTEAGSRLLAWLGPAFSDITEAVEAVNAFRGKRGKSVGASTPRLANADDRMDTVGKDVLAGAAQAGRVRALT